MKKITLTFSLLIGTLGFAQSTQVSNLKQNMESIETLQQLLSTEYSSVAETKNVVPTKTFEWLNTMVFNAYGDATAQQQAKSLETEFGSTFNGSKWKFQAIDKQNGSQAMEITTLSGEKQTANFTCSGAQFTSGNLIQGVDFQAYLFQHKTNTKHFILLFAISNGMTIASEFNQQ
ncbi:MAG: hypothetical protein IT221_07675 [Fluviicola sp.]|nr:hypothetical protein [Fluviicola sp.]